MKVDAACQTLVVCVVCRCAHAGCGRVFNSLEGLRQHARSADHGQPTGGGSCADCGRLTLPHRKRRSQAKQKPERSRNS